MGYSYSYYMSYLPKTNERPRKFELMQPPSVKNSAGIKGKHSQSFCLFQIILLTMSFQMVSNTGCWWRIRWEGVCPLQKITFFLKLFCFLNFWLSWAVYGILVPQTGMEPRPLALREWSSKHWTTRDFLGNHFFVKEAQNTFCPSLFLLKISFQQWRTEH